MAGLTLEQQKREVPKPKDTNLTQYYDKERTWFSDGNTGKCYANKDMRVELDPKTLLPLGSK